MKKEKHFKKKYFPGNTNKVNTHNTKISDGSWEECGVHLNVGPSFCNIATCPNHGFPTVWVCPSKVKTKKYFRPYFNPDDLDSGN